VREAATICPRPCKLTFDLLTLKVVSVTCDVGYLCANFSLPRPLFLDVSPRIGAPREVVHVSLGYEQSKLISSHSTLASIQHVGVRLIVPPGGVSWKQLCSLMGAPPHDDDVVDDDDDDDDEAYLFSR